MTMPSDITVSPLTSPHTAGVAAGSGAAPTGVVDGSVGALKSVLLEQAAAATLSPIATQRDPGDADLAAGVRACRSWRQYRAPTSQAGQGNVMPGRDDDLGLSVSGLSVVPGGVRTVENGAGREPGPRRTERRGTTRIGACAAGSTAFLAADCDIGLRPGPSAADNPSGRPFPTTLHDTPHRDAGRRVAGETQADDQDEVGSDVGGAARGAGSFAALQVRDAYNRADQVKLQAGLATSATGPAGALIAWRTNATTRRCGPSAPRTWWHPRTSSSRRRSRRAPTSRSAFSGCCSVTSAAKRRATTAPP